MIEHRDMKNRKIRVGDTVRFHSTSSIELDGKFGKVLGFTAKFPEVDFAIVEINFSLSDRPDKAIQMITSCQELIIDDFLGNYYE